MTKKKVIKGVILFTVYNIIFIFLIRYVVNNAEIMQRIASAPLHYVFLGMCSSAVCMILTGLMDVCCAWVYGVKIRYGESIGLTYIASSINLILPLQMGSIVKAVYFKKKITLSYSKYISIVSGTVVINLMVTFVQLIVCLIISALKWEVSSFYIFVLTVIFAAAIICFALALFFQDSIMKILPFKKISVPIMQGFFELMNDRKAMFLVTINLIVSALLGGLRFSFIFKMLGFDSDVLNSMLYYGFYAASTIVPILPGNIGISETLVGIMNTILGSDFDIGVTVVLVNRVYYYMVAIAGALMAAFPIWQLYNKAQKTNREDLNE